MRFLFKGVCLAVGLLAISLASSSVRADDLAIGSFTLPHETQWNSTTLPAGNYTFRLARTQSNARMLMIRGEKQSMSVFIYGESWCRACDSRALNLEVRRGMRYVSSLDLAGYHVDFKVRESAGAREAEMAKKTAQPQSEQVAVQVESDK